MTALSQATGHVTSTLLDRGAGAAAGVAEHGSLHDLREGLFSLVVALSDQIQADADAATEQVRAALRCLFSVVAMSTLDEFVLTS